jgi:hypothetical protein
MDGITGKLKNTVFWDVSPWTLATTDRPLTRRFLQQPHGVTSQKTAFFIVTAMKTSQLA